MRVAWRPSKTFNWAVSIENPEQQLGASLVELPACCSSDLNAQYNVGSAELRTPNLLPDIVTRIAVNPTPSVHLDAGGVFRIFRHTVAPYDEDSDFTALAGGGSINGAVRPTSNTKLIGQFALGAGVASPALQTAG